ncbi:MAG: aldo/keto reductase [Candidatus Micrarchaeaceae archaeon]
MFYKALGKTKEKISAIGIGTWKIPNDSKQATEAMQYAFENGINFVDTAEMYGNEELVGKAVEAYGDVFVATKVSPHHFHYDDLIKACEASLRRLNLKTIDLYQLHWPNNSVPISETMKAMEKLYDEGKIRHIGVSNFSIEELSEAQAALSHAEIVSDQVEYSLVVREAEQGLLQFCNKESITLIAYSPLARGAMLKNSRLVSVLEDIGRRYGATPAQVALAYLTNSGNVIPIPKASNKEHMAENIKAVSLKISEADLGTLRNLEGFSVPPLAGKALRLFLKNTSLWSKMMERIERSRKSGAGEERKGE